MRHLALVFGLALTLCAGGATTVHAQNSSDRTFGRAVAGVYLLTQTDGYMRLLTLNRDGTASHVSPQQTTIGFTAGQGAWRRTGESQVRVRVIDFNFDRQDGKPTGPSLIRYDLTLSDLDPSGFQSVAGRYGGDQYAPGQNPLEPGATPVRSFGIEFTGRRVRVPLDK